MIIVEVSQDTELFASLELHSGDIPEIVGHLLVKPGGETQSGHC